MPSWPLILKDDPSVLFTSAGMQPLVPYFLGKKQPPAKRIVAVQKVFRATDIEEVGRDGYHQTFFEMLGNFGIGDYWKKEAIEGAGSCHHGVRLRRQQDGRHRPKSDDEAYEIDQTLALLPPERMIRLGDEENTWALGPTACMATTARSLLTKVRSLTRQSTSGKTPGENCGRYLEILNYVSKSSTQSDGTLTPLAKRNIDTGAGLERLTQVLQNVPGDGTVPSLPAAGEEDRIPIGKAVRR